MKAILLQTPTADNSGARRDAGEQLTIGDAGEELTLARAEALVAAYSAVDIGPLSPTASLLEAEPAEKPAKKGN